MSQDFHATYVTSHLTIAKSVATFMFKSQMDLVRGLGTVFLCLMFGEINFVELESP